MRHLVAAVSLVGLFMHGMPSGAAADPDPAPNPDTEVGADDGGYWIGQSEKAGSAAPSTDSSPSGAVADPVDPVAGTAGCWGADQVAGDLVQFSYCTGEPAEPVLTVGLIRNAFAELKLPAGTLVIQPPDGLTLVNFDTNFYTTSTQPIARTVTLLGRRVTLEATPSTFHWTFGDGQRLSTSEPGAPYPALTITHNYLAKGTYRPTLGTTYTGRYRVSGGPWRQIPGTVTINGTSQALRAIEAQPKLVSY